MRHLVDGRAPIGPAPSLGQLRQRREELLPIFERYGASEVRVFGSVARGDERTDSDIDFLVCMEAGRSLFDLGELVWDLEDALGCAVDVVTEGGLRAGTVFAESARLAEVPL